MSMPNHRTSSNSNNPQVTVPDSCRGLNTGKHKSLVNEKAEMSNKTIVLEAILYLCSIFYIYIYKIHMYYHFYDSVNKILSAHSMGGIRNM